MTNASDVQDSVTHLTAAHRGRAVLCASHGGGYAGYYAARMGVGAVILNDAGIGRERAGVAGLDLLQGAGVPAATCAHVSGRIGDGADMLAHGVLSCVNDRASALGVTQGMSCKAALARLASAPLAPAHPIAAQDEARFELRAIHGIGVVAIDSNALVLPADVGRIVVTGSHGGLLGGRADTAIKYDVAAAIYNDAGIGKDGAGISRLPALDARGIAGACVSAFSARVGDARSTLEHGYISALNETAARHGGAIGQSCRDFVAAVAAAIAGNRSK